MIEEIRELFQNFIAPQLEGIKGDIKAFDAKFDSSWISIAASSWRKSEPH